MSWQPQCGVISSRSIFWIAVALMLALCGVGSQTAHASCGDHLQRMPQHIEATGGVGHQNSPLIPATPCNGPGCRRAPVVPDTPNSMDVRTASIEGLLTDSRAFPHGEITSDLSQDDFLLPLKGHRAGLDRPPQSV